jgi:hypothetical protein
MYAALWTSTRKLAATIWASLEFDRRLATLDCSENTASSPDARAPTMIGMIVTTMRSSTSVKP